MLGRAQRCIAYSLMRRGHRAGFTVEPYSYNSGSLRRKREPALERQISMNITSKILIAGLTVALAACGKSTQADVDKATRDRNAEVAKAGQDAQPSVDAAHRELAKAEQQGNAKVADAQTSADREIGNATVKQSKEQAKADYDVSIAGAEGDLSVALQKCGMQSADAKNACEQDAHSIHDQSIAAAKAKLDSASQQAD
jgi:hypothetical protein